MKGYVSKNGKMGYRDFPKVACTTIKLALYEMEEEEEFSSHEHGFHIHQYVTRRKTSTMDQCERRFVVLRDPVKRFLSAYGNRVTFYEELSKEKVPKGLHHLMPHFNPTLDQFIENLDAYLNQKAIYHHTRPISDFMEGESLSYFSDIYKFEELANLETEFCSLFGSSVSFKLTQTGGKKFFLNDLSKSQMVKLIGYYEQDYKLLQGYYSEGAIWHEWEEANNSS